MPELIELLIELICGANRGKWPLTFSEWEYAAGAYNLRIKLVEERMLFGRGAAYGSTIVIYIGDENWFEALAVTCHEVAECLLDGENLPPFNTPGAWSRHQVAQLVEFHYRHWLRERK